MTERGDDRETRRRPEHNVLSLLASATSAHPERPALVFGGGEGAGDITTFADLWRRAALLGVGLRKTGLEPGDRAIVMVPMSPDLYAVLLALLKIGAVAVFVDPWIGWRQIAAFSAFAEPRAFIGVGRSHLLRWLDPRLRSLPITVTTGRRMLRLPARRTLRELEAVGAAEPDRYDEVHPVSEGDSGLITFTSGSSGVPKGANRTHGFLAAQHAALAGEFAYRADDVDMPMFPIFALNNLAQGLTSVIPDMDFLRVDRIDAARILTQMRRQRVTTATASPPFFDRLAALVAERAGERPALRRILTGGAPVSQEQLRSWGRAFPGTEIQVVYGSTEAEPVAHIRAEERLEATSDVHPRAPGFCVGRPCERVSTRLTEIRNGPLPAEPQGPGSDGIGELLVAGEHVCKDYYKNPEAVAENKLTDPSGVIWHRMGDTGYFDDAGRFWLVGRVHSTIFRAAGPVHPQLVEQAAAGGDARIRRAAALGLARADGGSRVILVLEKRGTDSAEELERAARERLSAADLEVDEVMVTTSELPLDPRHRSKIDYQRLRELLEERSS